MEKKYALIKNGEILNHVVCDDSIVNSMYANDYDEIVEITGNYVGKVSESPVLTTEEQAAQDKRDLIDKKIKRLRFGEEVKAEVAIINDSKSWDASQWNTYMSDVNIGNLSSMLKDGYLQTARDLLANTDLSSYYTSGEKQSIIDLLDNYLVSE